MKTSPNLVFIGDRSAESPPVAPVFPPTAGVFRRTETLAGSRSVISAGVEKDTPTPPRLKRITKDDHHRMRLLYASGKSQSYIAKEFGVSQSAVSRVTRGIARPPYYYFE